MYIWQLCKHIIMSNKRVTLQDIANELGLSRNTVSKAMNNTGSIAEETKKKIFKAAAEMGYKEFAQLPEILPVPKASTIFATQDSKEIALFTHSLLGSSHFGSKLLDSFQKKIGEFGYTLSVYMIRDYELEHLVYPANFNSERCAGILCLEIFSEPYSRFLCNQSIPLLFVDTVVNHFNLNLAADLLYMENKTSTYIMLKSIIDQGYKNISFVGDYNHCQSFYERWSAYCQVMTDQNIAVQREACILEDDSSPYHDVAWLSNRIRLLPSLPDAFFCANDYLAICMLKALKALNLSVPSDIMVCGFDNSPEATIIEPSLTTVKIPSSAMGFAAAEMLLSRIGHKEMPYRTTYIGTDVIYRGSTKRK